jgi:phosphatidylglycerol lysyltransferase
MEAEVNKTEIRSLVPSGPSRCAGRIARALRSGWAEAWTGGIRTQITGKLHRLLRWAPALLFALALVVVQHELKDREFAELSNSWRHVPWHLVVMAILLTMLNYGILAGYDLLALRFTGHRVPLARILLTSFIGYGISNNTGHAWASGGSVRYRFYKDVGVPGADIAKISLFLALTYIVGVLTLGLIGTTLAPGAAQSVLGHSGVFTLVLGGSFAALIAYWTIVFCWRKPLRMKGIEISLPTPSLALGQTIVSTFDLIAASLVLWVFIKDVPGLTFPAFLSIYATASLLALVSQVPGGLGVFEGAFLWLAGPLFGASHPIIVAGLVLYRVIYYFIPLATAGLLLIAHDIYANRARFAKVGYVASRVIPATVPQIFSLLLFLTGGMLLVSGATPALQANIRWLRDVVPLPLLELSHLTGSLVGVLLLFLARAVLQRIDAAWYGALGLLAVGIVASLLKGLDWQEALILAVMFGGIYASHRHFYRKSSLLQQPLSPSWLVMIAVVIAGATWLGFFSYKHVEYSNELWWQFSYKNDASRFLRSLIVIGVPVIALLIRHLLTVRRPQALSTVPPQQLDQALPLIRRSADTQGFLALLGDKALFWSDDRQAFICYVATRNYWIAMSDPVGLESSFESLLWRFREEADRYGAKAVFYQVAERHLPLYLNLGLALLKLGQEARVPLADFGLEGKRRESLRHGRNKLIKQGFAFKVLDPAELAVAMPRLRQISDLWLKHKKAHEKRFSLGFFEEAYVARTRVAVATDARGEIMAFANLWEVEGKEEMSIDLMRYDPASPRGVMDLLFAELMLLGRDQGYRWFNLGVAPLSGLERRPLAPLWHKIGTAIFDLGEEFYNFEGLYHFKAKFDPDWRPRYLASPPGLSVPIILLTITRLIAGNSVRITARPGARNHARQREHHATQHGIADDCREGGAEDSAAPQAGAPSGAPEGRDPRGKSRRRGRGDQRLLDLHHRADHRPLPVARDQCLQRKGVGSLSLHPAQSLALLPGRLRCTDHHDGAEPAGGYRPKEG